MYRIIRWVEDTSVKDGTFSLPGRKALLKSDAEYEVVLIAATESPIERSKRGKNAILLRQEKAAHYKDEVVVNKVDGQIVCTSFANGKHQ